MADQEEVVTDEELMRDLFETVSYAGQVRPWRDVLPDENDDENDDGGESE